MTKASGGVRFLATRMLVAGLATGTMLTVWGGIAVTAAPAQEEPVPLPESVEHADAPDAITARAETAGQVVVVERQPVIYVTEYVQVDGAVPGGQQNSWITGASSAPLPVPTTETPAAPRVPPALPPAAVPAVQPTVAPAPASAPPKAAATKKTSKGS